MSDARADRRRRFAEAVAAVRRSSGTLALEWVWFAFVLILVFLVLSSPLGYLLLLLPELLGIGLVWMCLILVPAAALVAVCLGVAAVIEHGLLRRGAVREALAGLLAVALCGAGAWVLRDWLLVFVFALTR